MINYYFKYLELLDTVFLALKKKPLGTRNNCIFPSLRAHSICSSFPARLPSLCHCSLVLYSAQRPHQRGKSPSLPHSEALSHPSA